MSKKLWSPDKLIVTKHFYIYQFMEYVNKKYQLQLNDYPNLHHWSVENIEDFWLTVWEFCEVKYSKPPEKILSLGKRMQECKWFQGAKLNFAENLLKRDDNHTAIISTSERGDYQSMSFAALHHKVANMAHTLRNMGLKAGDRICAQLPNTPEAVIAMLATTSIGAIWSACSPDFGLQGLLDRFQQIEPKILFTVDGHFYKGKNFLHQDKNIALQKNLPSVTHTIVFSHLEKNCDLSGLKNAVHFSDCLSEYNESIDFEQLPFDHPIYIMYSSGTTGKPKCMVHSAGGTLLQHLKELMLHTNLQPKFNIFFNSTVTWMMWHWMVSSLAVGAAIVLYEGSILYPKPDALFDLIDKAKINIFGAGAKFFEMSEKLGLEPKETHKLSSLYSILSTASPLLDSSFEYIYEKINSNIRVSSISGGSDIISCFALGNPILPVYQGELQCIGLGMDVKIFNAKGESVIGEKGELVCTKPFPSMPVYFWNDPFGEKYQHAYFDKFPNVWAHGDFAMITENGGLIIYGRSDATLNPSGVRIGSAEIYLQMEQIPEVLESVVVGQKFEGAERIILFVIMRDGHKLDDILIKKIKTQIKSNTSPYHVPAKIIAVSDIPRTANGKISEIAVKKVINGDAIDNKEALANPECLEQYTALRE